MSCEKMTEFLQVVQIVSIFGGSTPFTIIVSSNAEPTRHFTNHTVCHLISAAWLLFFMALRGGATVVRSGLAHESRTIRYLGPIPKYWYRIMSTFVFSSFALLAVAILGYSDAGWAALAIIFIG